MDSSSYTVRFSSARFQITDQNPGCVTGAVNQPPPLKLNTFGRPVSSEAVVADPPGRTHGEHTFVVAGGFVRNSIVRRPFSRLEPGRVPAGVAVRVHLRPATRRLSPPPPTMTACNRVRSL